ncbi:hypothetical protein [Streptomyces sennicomposti]
MPDEPTEGEVVPPIMDYTPETVEPDPEPVPTTPPSDDGSPIIGGPAYPVPGEPGPPSDPSEPQPEEVTE